jgi:CRISPR-associated protein Csb3
MNEQPAIRITVDLSNAGQFFACCGLLELANRLWDGAESWFSGRKFHVRPLCARGKCTVDEFVKQLRYCRLSNTMSASQIQRLEGLSSMGAKERRRTPGLEDEKKELEKLRREEPIVLHEPFGMRVDWFLDDNAGGSRFKTWAGQQSVLDIATAMKGAADEAPMALFATDDWLSWTTDRDDLPFNFDSDLGAQASALDVGFSIDPLGMSRRTRPFVELLAFIGLQRFRPMEHTNQNRFTYVPWESPLSPAVAASACAGLTPQPGATVYDFRLLYRTKYLKSFLSAQPSRGAQ